MVNGINQIETIHKIERQHNSFENRGAPSSPPALQLPKDKVTLSGRSPNSPQSSTKTPWKTESLTPEQQRQVSELKKRDAEVKAHERAHMAAGGGIVQGGATYQYQRGPDGRTYAVGGEVSIDVSSERTPEATIRKMQQVKQAALAPAQPSGTDKAVAARAAQAEAQARVKKNAELEAPKSEDASWQTPPTDSTQKSDHDHPFQRNIPDAKVKADTQATKNRIGDRISIMT